MIVSDLVPQNQDYAEGNLIDSNYQINLRHPRRYGTKPSLWRSSRICTMLGSLIFLWISNLRRLEDRWCIARLWSSIFLPTCSQSKREYSRIHPVLRSGTVFRDPPVNSKRRYWWYWWLVDDWDLIWTIVILTDGQLIKTLRRHPPGTEQSKCRAWKHSP